MKFAVIINESGTAFEVDAEGSGEAIQKTIDEFKRRRLDVYQAKAYLLTDLYEKEAKK